MANGFSWVYISLISMLFFKAINKLVAHWFPPPVKLQVQWRKVWLWGNLTTSWVHSIISATLSVYSVYSTPSIIEDMIYTKNNLLCSTLAVSIGYFLYDLIDLAVNDRERSLCIIVHHMLVLSSFLVCVIGDKLMPFAIFSLLVEVNSIFLHARRLMRMTEFDPKGIAYKTNKVLLFITFIVFRFVSVGWVILCLLKYRHVIHQFAFAVGFSGTTIATLQNVFLLHQVWSSEAKWNDKKHLSHAENGKIAVEMDKNANRRIRIANTCSAPE